jgi:hypothetical protein
MASVYHELTPTSVTALLAMVAEIVRKIWDRHAISHRRLVKITANARKIELETSNAFARTKTPESSVRFTSSRIHCARKIHATMAHAVFRRAPQNGNASVQKVSRELDVK